MAADRDSATVALSFAAAAAAVDAEREGLLVALSAASRQGSRSESTNLLIDALGRLNDRCEELRSLFFPQTATLSIANGTATTWSKSGLMRVVWRKETSIPRTRAIAEHEA